MPWFDAWFTGTDVTPDQVEQIQRAHQQANALPNHQQLVQQAQAQQAGAAWGGAAQQQGLYGIQPTTYEEQLRRAIEHHEAFLRRLDEIQRNATPQTHVPLAYRDPVKRMPKVKAIKRNLPDWW